MANCNICPMKSWRKHKTSKAIKRLLTGVFSTKNWGFHKTLYIKLKRIRRMQVLKI